MRIGVEVQNLSYDFKSGLYYYCSHLVKAIGELETHHKITLFTRGKISAEKFPEIRKQCLPLPLCAFYPPKRFHRLRMALTEPNRQDAIFSITTQIVPPRSNRVNAYLIPDLTPLLLAQYHIESNQKYWASRFEEARVHADLVITFSEHTKRDVVNHLGIPEERVRAVPLAPAGHFRPFNDHNELSKELGAVDLQPGNYILTVGTIEPRKNHIALMRAYRQLLDRGELQGQPLVFAGPKGWNYEGILGEIERLGLQKHVRQLGHFKRLEVLMNGAAVMVYPSLFEGFGLPPLEAMACGTPVITSNTTSLPEVVGNAGIMVDPTDIAALSSAIARVVNDPQLRLQMRADGLARAKKYTWKNTAAETIEAIETAFEHKFKGRKWLYYMQRALITGIAG